jgi:hypothetical protein
VIKENEWSYLKILIVVGCRNAAGLIAVRIIAMFKRENYFLHIASVDID